MLKFMKLLLNRKKFKCAGCHKCFGCWSCKVKRKLHDAEANLGEVYRICSQLQQMKVKVMERH